MYEYVEEWPVCNLWEDVATVCQIAYHCKSIGTIEEPLYFYYVNSEGICATSTYKIISAQKKANINIVADHINKYEDLKKYKKELIYRKCVAKVTNWNFPWIKYLNFFPEVNLTFFFNPYVPREWKLGHLSKCFGIHGYSKILRR